MITASAGVLWAAPFWLITLFVLQFFRDPAAGGGRRPEERAGAGGRTHRRGGKGARSLPRPRYASRSACS
ncbi:MAG: hypothetical protein MZV65_48340 [Chromatiales bacterium]|nr:hypothetical protein [Chromatiales bacterium]